LSKALKKKGFVFVGPTTMYALMEAIGIVDDHLVGCHRRGCATGGKTREWTADEGGSDDFGNPREPVYPHRSLPL
jgi:hypothetical protein